MNKLRSLLLWLFVAVPLFVAVVAGWVWVTIPEAPDPETLPSAVLEPPSPAHAEPVEEARWFARSLLAEEKLPGLSVAVAVDGEIVWAEGFRWADMEEEIQVTPETLFRIGGVSTTLTAAAVGLLAQRGQLDLDAPVQRYVPGFPDKEWPISTRELMAHTAGLRDLRGESEEFRKTGCTDDAERLTIFADDPLRFRPGTAYDYSTYGWVLVGAAVAGAADEPYFTFLEREVLGPLGLDRTVVDFGDGIELERAHLYYPRMALNPRYGLQEAPETDLTCILPAGGFLSTPSELVRFGSALMDGALLDPATVEELWAPVRLASGESRGQALGWIVQEVPMGADQTLMRIVGQGLGGGVERSPISAVTVGGQVPGGTASLLLVPDHGVAVAVAANVSGGENVALLAVRLADAFVRHLETR